MRFVRLTVFPDEGLHPSVELSQNGAGPHGWRFFTWTPIPMSPASCSIGSKATRPAWRFALAEDPTVRHAEVFLAPSDRSEDIYSYVHVERGSPACELIEVVRRNDLIVETPLEFRTNGGIRVLLAGRQGGINRAFQTLQSITEFEVISTGDYDPANKGLLAELTGKQRLVLRTAIDLGYYEVPKQATHIDIAAEVGCATSTVDEHLRKAESTVFQTILQ
ncbi:MAG: helix-turn-helix domain-containing protein [Natrialbaceae archaeon]|nr:helix-turn-helix domain-containing protein [Natrialbaceae archaeon]